MFPEVELFITFELRSEKGKPMQFTEGFVDKIKRIFSITNVHHFRDIEV